LVERRQIHVQFADAVIFQFLACGWRSDLFEGRHECTVKKAKVRFQKFLGLNEVVIVSSKSKVLTQISEYFCWRDIRHTVRPRDSLAQLRQMNRLRDRENLLNYCVQTIVCG